MVLPLDLTITIILMFRSCAFALLLVFAHSDPSIIPLSESTQYFSSLSQSNYSYFYTFINPSKSLDIAVQPISGDTDLFLNVISNNTDPKSLPMPSAASSDYSSMSAVVLESIHLASSTLKTCIEPCSLLISVLCLSKECEFSIFYDQGSYLVLQPNRPSQGSTLAGKYTYFRYPKFDTKPILIVLTVLGSSNPDLYVAKDRIPLRNNATWSSTTYGGETLQITGALEGIYYLGVFCDTKSEFSITVSTDIEPITQLYSGLPQFSQITAKSRSVYYFWSYSRENIQIKATVIYGEITILVNTQNPLQEEVYEKIPTFTNYMWKSFDINNQDNSVWIYSADRNFCTDCNLVISVIGLTSSEFTIVAKNQQYLEVLQNAVPVYGIVEANKIDSYMFTLDSSTSVEFRLQVYSGDADLFIGTSTPVSENFYTWASASSFAEEVISIPTGDKAWICGTYYLAVSGWGSSAYTLTALVSGTVITLIQGMHRQYSLARPMNFYLHTLGSVYYTCTITGLHEDLHPLVFINSDSIAPAIPTPELHQVVYDNPHYYDPIINFFTFGVVESEDRIYAISVHSNIKAGKDQYFSLGCVSAGSPVKLPQHSYSVYRLEKESMQFELFTLTEHNVVVTLGLCRGTMRMEISKDPVHYIQDPSINVFRAADRVVGFIRNPKGSYYIRVTGDHWGCFELFTEVERSFSLSPGGEVLYREDGKGGFEVQWPKAKLNNEESSEIIEYYVYASSSFREGLDSACTLKMLNKDNEVSLLAVVTGNSFVVQGQESVIVSVVAVLGKFRMSPGGYATYNPIQLVYKEEESEQRGWWKIIFGGVIVAGIAGLIIKKYKDSRPRRAAGGYELSRF